METITWSQFKAQLEAHADKHLNFEYAANTRVDASYHITEIKQAVITSVDCGGLKNEWTDVIVQLWEPGQKQQDKPMKVAKALSIIALVERSLEINAEAIVKLEYGNNEYDARQLLPLSITAVDDELVVRLHADSVQCKANDRGQICGSPSANGADTRATKAHRPLVQLTTVGNQCEPGSGCC